MRYACTNCLEPHRGPYQMCDKCRQLAMQMYPPEWPDDDEADVSGTYIRRYNTHCTLSSRVDDYDADYAYGGEADQVYIEGLKERRMASYARARRMAKRG